MTLTPKRERLNRTQLIAAVGNDLWRVLGGRAGLDSNSSASGKLSSVSRQNLADLLRAHIALSGILGDCIDQARRILTQMPSSISYSRTESDGEVRGEVDWSATVLRRIDSGNPTLFVSWDTAKAYNTRLARLVKTALNLSEDVLTSCPQLVGTLDDMVKSRFKATRRALGNQKLARVRPFAEPRQTRTRLAATRYEVDSLVRFIELYWNTLSARDDQAIFELFKAVAIVPEDDDRLFELLVGFGICRAMQDRGWKLRTLQSLPAQKLPFASLVKGGKKIKIFSQRTLKTVLRREEVSLYSQLRQDNGIVASQLRPDFVLRTNDGRTLIVEVKFADRETNTHVRQGLGDVMAYIHDYSSHFVGQPHPWAVVVASDIDASPNLTSEVMIGSQGHLDRVAEVLDVF